METKLSGELLTDTRRIVSKFDERCRIFEFHRHKAVDITSRIDKSVYLIGSTISVLKPYIINNIIPATGIFMIQPSIRTQNLEKYKNNGDIKWSSCFLAMGTLTRYDKLKESCKLIWEFLTMDLGVKYSDIMVKVSSNDKDLVKYWKRETEGSIINKDSENEQYYIHKYGLESVTGRSMNIALRQNNNSFSDIGNIVVIEKSGRPIGIELALGVSTLLSRIYELESSVQTSIIAVVKYPNTQNEIKFLDTIMVITNLIREGTIPGASHMIRRILREYIAEEEHFRKAINYSLDEVLQLVKEYEKLLYRQNIIEYGKLKEYLCKY